MELIFSEWNKIVRSETKRKLLDEFEAKIEAAVQREQKQEIKDRHRAQKAQEMQDHRKQRQELRDQKVQLKLEAKLQKQEIKDRHRAQKAQEIEDRRKQRKIKAMLRHQKKIEAERKRQNIKELKIQHEQKLRRRLLIDEDIYLLKSWLKHEPLSFQEKSEIRQALSAHDSELKRRARQVRNHIRYSGKRRRLNQKFKGSSNNKPIDVDIWKPSLWSPS